MTTILRLAEYPISATVTVRTVQIVEGTRARLEHEVHCTGCDHVDIWEHLHHAIDNAKVHVCARADAHRPRCCDNPSPTASVGLGLPGTAFVTVWCTNCSADLVILDPPSSGNTAPYVGQYQRQSVTA